MGHHNAGRYTARVSHTRRSPRRSLPRSPRGALLTALLLGLLSTGCAHRVLLQTEPPGAEVYEGGELIGHSPVELRRTMWPFRKVPITVRMKGHRAVTVRLDRDIGPIRWLGDCLTLKWRRLLGMQPRRVHTLVLVPRHGRSGSWTPEDVPD